MAVKKKGVVRAAKKPSTRVDGPVAVVFRLGDVPFARRVIASFGLEGIADAPCFVVPKKHAKAFAPIWKTKERRIDAAEEEIVMWLVGEIASTVEEESSVLTAARKGGSSCGYHLGFELASFTKALGDLGFEVRSLESSTVEPTPAPKKKIPALFTLHDAVERWSPRQKKAFRESLREGRVPALLPSPGEERIDRFDRVAILEDIAGDARDLVREAVLEGIVGEFWKSADIVLLAALADYAGGARHDWPRAHDPLAAIGSWTAPTRGSVAKASARCSVPTRATEDVLR